MRPYRQSPPHQINEDDLDYKMKRIFCALLFLALIGCSSSPEELFETAELEMLQTNYPNAIKLYQDVIERDPGSKLAAKARGRLAEAKVRLHNSTNMAR